MNIYLAGPCDAEHRNLMHSIGQTIRNYGYEVYCPFELKIPNAWDLTQEEWGKQVYNADIEAINKCDLMICISFGRISSSGTSFEQGYARGRGIPISVFQVNDNLTSLMNYWGCNTFSYCNASNLLNEIIWAIDHVTIEYHEKCKTILT